jgi:hypothetical protein
MTRMRRRLAVGVVPCNRRTILFHVYLRITPVRRWSLPSSTPPQQDAHTLSFRVTSRYMTHTYNPVQPPHAHAARLHESSSSFSFLFFSPASTLSIRLSISCTQTLFFLLRCISFSQLQRAYLFISRFSSRLDFGLVAPLFYPSLCERAGWPFPPLILVVVIAVFGVAAEQIEVGLVARQSAKL